MKKRYARAFTLIELLIVIAIISVLAAILFPVFATAREKARQTTCLSNQKQIGIAFLQYVQDFDECFPLANTTKPLGRGWAGRLYPYIKNTKGSSSAVFQCPDDQTLPINASGNAISYAMNGQLGNSPTTFWSAQTRQISELVSPSVTVMCYEVEGWSTSFSSASAGQVETDSPGGYGPCASSPSVQSMADALAWKAANPTSSCTAYTDGQPGTSPPAENAGARHAGGANYLLADGHVKWLAPTSVSIGVIAGNVPVAASPTNMGSYVATFGLK